jgi:hypothetical protein
MSAREGGVGRVLVASLHQAIGDVLPPRLAFYENWLSTGGLRDGTIGLASMYAVLSFLRQEGDAYAAITGRAGDYAARWLVDSLSPMQRAAIKAAPGWLRDRIVLRLARQLVRSAYDGSRVASKVRGGLARIEVRASVFCAVREPAGRPLCGFYTAGFSRLLDLFDLASPVEVLSCRGTGDPSCTSRFAVVHGVRRGGAAREAA